MSKILVVDNGHDFRSTISGLLTDTGHTVQPVATEGEALAAITREPFDFALIDVRLHEEGEDDESGLSLAMAMRTLDPRIRVILMTRYVRAPQVVRAIRYHGVVDFIAKDHDVGENILKAIAKAQVDPVRLRQILTNYFDMSELRTLCFDLGVDYESLPGDGKGDKARELVAYFERRGYFSRLVEACYKLRPQAPWWGVPEKIKEPLPVPQIASPRRSRFQTGGDATQLSMSLAAGRPLVARAHGRHVCSVFTPKVLQVSIDRYARKADIARQDASNLRFHVKEIGRELWRDVFTEHPEVNRAYLEACAKSRLVSLLVETPRECLGLPFEFMYSDNPSEYLVLQHPFARFLCEASPKREAISPQMLALTEKLHVLVVASNTLPPIDGVDVEAQELSDFLKRQNFGVKLILTEQATRERVREELRASQYDVLHYAGHGSYDEQSPEESSLYFWEKENKRGSVVPMTATEVKMLLGQSEARLVYLSCCHGTASGDQATLLDDDFLGLADAVIQAGVPSVLGFRWPVSDVGARKLAMAFYQSLLEQGSPEVALWSARCELAIDRNDTTWLSPIFIHQM